MTMTVNQAYNTMIGQVANAAYCIGCLGCKSELDLNIKITPIKSEIVNDQFHLRLSVDEYVLDILVGLVIKRLVELEQKDIDQKHAQDQQKEADMKLNQLISDISKLSIENKQKVLAKLIK